MGGKHDHERWKVGPFAHGAYGETGGHWSVLGLLHTWLPHPPYRQYEWSLFNLVAVRWTTDRGWDLGFAKLECKFTPARWRYMAREEARQRRASRKRYEKARAAALAQ
jgi:hypothetical protein